MFTSAFRFLLCVAHLSSKFILERSCQGLSLIRAELNERQSGRDEKSCNFEDEPVEERRESIKIETRELARGARGARMCWLALFLLQNQFRFIPLSEPVCCSF
jgi:hypothetical protein